MAKIQKSEHQVRLRHVQGDLGPFSVSGKTTIFEVQELAFAEWPADGVLAAYKPRSAAEIRLISSGKFIDVASTIDGIISSLGTTPSPDFILTLHLIIRPPGSKGVGGLLSGKGDVSSPSSSSSSPSSSNRCCGCIIS